MRAVRFCRRLLIRSAITRAEFVVALVSRFRRDTSTGRHVWATIVFRQSALIRLQFDSPVEPASTTGAGNEFSQPGAAIWRNVQFKGSGRSLWRWWPPSRHSTDDRGFTAESDASSGTGPREGSGDSGSFRRDDRSWVHGTGSAGGIGGSAESIVPAFQASSVRPRFTLSHRTHGASHNHGKSPGTATW